MRLSTFEKYYGKRKYKEIQQRLREQGNPYSFTEEEKIEILRNIVILISERKYTLYHDLMDDLAEEHIDWFAMLVFNRKYNSMVLDCIKQPRNNY